MGKIVKSFDEFNLNESESGYHEVEFTANWDGIVHNDDIRNEWIHPNIHFLYHKEEATNVDETFKAEDVGERVWDGDQGGAALGAGKDPITLYTKDSPEKIQKELTEWGKIGLDDSHAYGDLEKGDPENDWTDEYIDSNGIFPRKVTFDLV